MPLTLEQLMALKQKMAAQSPRAVPPMTRQPVARGVAPGAYGYADGGSVDDSDPLAAYMPTDAEAEASGFPPGPQRKQYIAQQRMNAAQRAAMPAPAAPAQVAPNPANAAYMPSAQQQMDSGLPPDPRRAAYMAAKAAQAAGQPGYADGGSVSDPVAVDARLRSLIDKKGLDQMVDQGILRGPGQADISNAQLQAGATGVMANPLYRRTVQPGSVYPTLPDVTDGADVPGRGNQPVDTSDTAMAGLQAKLAQQMAAKKAADTAASANYDDGGKVAAEDVPEAAAEESEAAAPAAEAPLKATLGEALGVKDPEALKAALEATRRSDVEAPYDAAEAAKEDIKPKTLKGKAKLKDLYNKAEKQRDEEAPSAEDIENKDIPEAETAAPDTAEKVAADEAAAGAMGVGGEETGAAAAASRLSPALAKALGLAAGVAIPNNAMASTEDSKEVPIPGTGKSIQGQDIVPTSIMYRGDKPDLNQLMALNKYMTEGDIASATAKPAAGSPPPAAPAATAAAPAAPESDEDEDEETPPTQAAKKAPSAAAPKTAAPVAAPAASQVAPTQQDAIAALLEKMNVGKTADDRLAQLQAQKQQMLQGQALLMGGDTIARAFARGRGAQMAPNTEYYNQMTARANAPIEAEMQRRAAVKDALNTGMTVYDLQDKQQADDPNSKPSQAAQKILLSTFPNLAGTSDLKNMSYSTIKGLAPSIGNVLTNQTRLEAAKERAGYMQLARQSSNDQKQTNNFNQTIQQLESQRSTNPAVGQAEKDLYAAQKAQTIQNLAPNGDLNQLNPQMSKLIQMEVAKIAKGGVSDREDLRALDPSTLQGKLSGVWQELSNNPTPANAGAFLKQYMDYARGIQKDAQKVITDHYGRVINSKMNQFTPEQKEYMKDNYMNRFGDANSGAKSNAVGDYAPDVINYARAHNLTNEEALRIKNARTGG